MTTTLARTADRWWIVDGGRAIPRDLEAATTREILEQRDSVVAARREGEAVDVGTLALESPITTPCRVVAQMVNYRSHAQDSGFDPARVLPTFFRKSSASVCGPTSDIVRPAHVRLLDYEVELGVVLGRSLEIGEMVTERSLPGLIAGLVVANDVSARDVQLTKGQFYESKSYPTFTPLGPYLVTPDELPGGVRPALDLSCLVNDEMVQSANTGDLVFDPVALVEYISTILTLRPGDVIASGTPGGVGHARKPPRYLAPGDVLTTDISGLGIARNRAVAEAV